MTSALISGINDAGIGVLYCGSDHMPNGLALPLGAHSRHAEIVEHQLAISKPLRNQIWKRIVTKKIENQAKTLALCFGDSAEVKKSVAMPRKSKATTRQIATAPPQVNTSRHFSPTVRAGMVL